MIGLERGSEMVVAVVDQADALGGSAVIPASVLGQVWRGGSRSARLAKLIKGCDIDTLDEGRAKEIGERLGARDATDIADGHVACCAAERKAIVVTSDEADIEALVEPGEVVRLIAI